MKNSLLFLLNFALLLLYFLSVYQATARTKQSQVAVMALQAALLEARLQAQRQDLAADFAKISSLTAPESDLSMELLGVAVLDSRAAVQSGWGMRAAITSRTRALLQAALQGRTVLELISLHGQPVWAAMKPAAQANRVLCALFHWQPADFSSENFQNARLLLWLDGNLIFPENVPAGHTLPATAHQTIFARENHWAGVAEFDGAPQLACAVPVKDFDAWEVTGALLLARPFVAGAEAMVVAARQPSSLAGLLIVLLAGIGLSIKLRDAARQNGSETA